MGWGERRSVADMAIMVIGMIVIGAVSWGGLGWARTPARRQEQKTE